MLAKYDFVQNNNYINEKTWNKFEKKNPKTKLKFEMKDINDDGILDAVVYDARGKMVAVDGWQLKKSDYPFRSLMKNRDIKDRNVKRYIKHFYDAGNYDVNTAKYMGKLSPEQQKIEDRLKIAHMSRAPPKVMSGMRYFQTFIFKKVYDKLLPPVDRNDPTYNSEAVREIRLIRKGRVPFLRASIACFRRIRKDVIDSFIKARGIPPDEQPVFICDLKESPEYKKAMLEHILNDREKLNIYIDHQLRAYIQKPELMEPPIGDEKYSITWATIEGRKRSDPRSKQRSSLVTQGNYTPIADDEHTKWDDEERTKVRKAMGTPKRKKARPAPKSWDERIPDEDELEDDWQFGKEGSGDEDDAHVVATLPSGQLAVGSAGQVQNALAQAQGGGEVSGAQPTGRHLVEVEDTD
jgi:hypothetical protein